MSNTVGEQLLSECVSAIYESVPNSSLDELRNKFSSIISKYNIHKIDSDKIHPDLSDKIAMFLSSKKLEGLSPLTLSGYKLDLNKFADYTKKKTDEITTADIRSYLSKFSDLKMSTIGKKLSTLKSFFSWLTSEEILQRDPTTRLKSPKTEKRLPKALTVEELEMMREACMTNRQRAFLEFAYASGCRLSEIQNLNRNCVNIQSMSCHVIGKGNKEREVYLSFKALYHLKKYLNARNDECEALLVTERKPHRRLSNRAIQREIDIITKNAGIEKRVSPHTLRHTFATLMLNNGAELVAIQELLGHSSPDTTMKYARISEERKRQQHKRYLAQ